MSQAFIEQWNRMSAANRALKLLTVMAKTNPDGALRISLDELEQLQDDEGVTQTCDGGTLVIRHAPVGTVLYMAARSQATERQPQWTNDTSKSPTPRRMGGLLDHQPPDRLSTLDDQLMAQRERVMNQQTPQQQAERARRSPLPVPEEMMETS